MPGDSKRLIGVNPAEALHVPCMARKLKCELRTRSGTSCLSTSLRSFTPKKGLEECSNALKGDFAY